MLKRLGLLAAAAMLVSAAAAQTPQITLTPILEGVNRPIGIYNAGDGSGRLFILSQGGPIYALSRDGQTSVFLDLTGRLSRDVNAGGYTERGVLGLAFSPNFAQDGRFYVNYTGRRGESIIARFSVLPNNPNEGNLASEEQLLAVQQPFPNHNGGDMAFGPDGFLYISLGDGGSAGDPINAGQRLDTLLGKILRIDVNTESGYAIPPSNPFVGIDSVLPEIWAYGLRNVWRFSFDSLTGDLFLADVGQGRMEEVNFEPAGFRGGANYGWAAFEGTRVFNERIRAVNPVPPIITYEHGENGCSITGGYVYRGTAVPALYGKYVYGDFCSGHIWAATRGADGTWTSERLLNGSFPVSSFGVDEDGELYVANYNGVVYRIDAR
jgi:glucose/arabinose dehydrogenase